MGIISLERIDNLIWLGRYSERIHLTIKEFFFYYDKMLDDPNLYKEYCYALQIPMIYENPKDFIVDMYAILQFPIAYYPIYIELMTTVLF